MTAFALRPLGPSRDAYRTCANGCTHRGGGIRKAHRRAVFLDTYYAPYTILLCRNCAAEWAATWDAQIAQLDSGATP